MHVHRDVYVPLDMELLMRAQPDFFGLSTSAASGFPHHVDSICSQRAFALGWANASSMRCHVLDDLPFSKVPRDQQRSPSGNRGRCLGVTDRTRFPRHIGHAVTT